MFRTIALNAAASLALGAATTVGITWGAAYFGWGEAGSLVEDFGPNGASVVSRGESWVRTRLECSPLFVVVCDVSAMVGEEQMHKEDPGRGGWREITPAWALQRATAIMTTRGAPDWRRLEAFGWPWRALHHEGDPDALAGSPFQTPPPIGAIVIDPATSAASRGRTTYLPCLPIWPGLLADIGVFAAAWALPMAAMPAIRRSIRTRRGRCTACGYDLRATPAGSPCPECGRSR